MQTTDVIVIGAGQAGLAVSHCLARRGIDHVVLERGRVAERWRSERWDSAKLLTPNWQSRLPGYAYDGPEPDGFMSMPEVVAFFERYAAITPAPIQSHTRVSSVAADPFGYRVRTDRGELRARNVVLATGHCDRPARPAWARTLDRRVHQLAPTTYRNPAALPEGGVLVVGASSSGVQIADELARAGRAVTLAVGRHTRLPRRYRGADILWWLDRIGAFDETVTEVHDRSAALAQPSLQLVGSEPPRDLDLGTLLRAGVRLCGRALGASGPHVAFEDDLSCTVQAADAKLDRLLQRIDLHARALAVQDAPAAAEPSTPIDLSAARAAASIDLSAERISSIVWATGFRRDYGFLELPVLDARDEIIHVRGVTPAAGLYVIGLRLLYTRKSSFIDGAALDAEYIAGHIGARLGIRASAAA
jgi:putative flavoprotein involved in K+ transport